MNKEKLQNYLQTAQSFLDKGRQYSLYIFISFVAILYGFLLFRISALTNITPTNDQVSSQAQSAHIPKLDEATIKQLQALQDNNVEIQTLFNEARSNPFQEN